MHRNDRRHPSRAVRSGRCLPFGASQIAPSQCQRSEVHRDPRQLSDWRIPPPGRRQPKSLRLYLPARWQRQSMPEGPSDATRYDFDFMFRLENKIFNKRLKIEPPDVKQFYSFVACREAKAAADSMRGKSLEPVLKSEGCLGSVRRCPTHTGNLRSELF